MLTERANMYLATLERRPSRPTREVETVLKSEGHPCFDPWLAFHEHYAGYVEPLGRDTAVWGVLHAQGYWIDTGRVVVEREPHADIWYVMCADVHPSYTYQLDNRGEFLGEPAKSFDVKVERNALVRAFICRGKARYLVAELNDPAFTLGLRNEATLAVDQPTADQYARYHVSDRYLLKEDLASGKFAFGWVLPG